MPSGTFQQIKKKEKKNFREKLYNVYHEMDKKKGKMNQIG